MLKLYKIHVIIISPVLRGAQACWCTKMAADFQNLAGSCLYVGQVSPRVPSLRMTFLPVLFLHLHSTFLELQSTFHRSLRALCMHQSSFDWAPAHRSFIKLVEATYLKLKLWKEYWEHLYQVQVSLNFVQTHHWHLRALVICFGSFVVIVEAICLKLKLWKEYGKHVSQAWSG